MIFGGIKMKRLLLCMILLCLAAVGVVLFGGLVHAQENVPRMTKEDLKPLVGDPNVIVIDVRSLGDWNKDTLMIKGAIREDPMDVPDWMDKYAKEKTLVFYCA
jgi:predicted sulfurtransferase